MKSPDPAQCVAPAREMPALANHDESRLPPAYGPRVLHMSAEMVAGADVFITSRSVTGLDAPAEPNVHPHRHAVSQTYLLLSPNGSLEAEVEVEGRTSVVRAPASAFIPAGALHALRVLRGTGTILSVVRSGTYE